MFIKRFQIDPYIQGLRLRLLDMARLVQRCVDSSIKTYQFGIREFYADAQDTPYEINIIRREITANVRRLLSMELPSEPDLRLVLSTARLCNSLHALHRWALKVAENSSDLLATGETPGCDALMKMSDLVNGLMGLCIVALFEYKSEHAKSVLDDKSVEHLYEDVLHICYRNIAQDRRVQAPYELAIAKNLNQMAFHIHEIAESIVFWLDNTDLEMAPKANLEQCEMQHFG